MDKAHSEEITGKDHGTDIGSKTGSDGNHVTTPATTDPAPDEDRQRHLRWMTHMRRTTLPAMRMPPQVPRLRGLMQAILWSWWKKVRPILYDPIEVLLLQIRRNLPQRSEFNDETNMIFARLGNFGRAPLCGPLWVCRLFRTSDVLDGSREVQFLDLDGVLRHHVGAASDLIAHDRGVAARLVSLGLDVPGDPAMLAQMIGSAEVPGWAEILEKPGWTTGALIFGLSLAFLGPLRPILGICIVGFHIYCRSSSGRFTIAAVAQSDRRQPELQSWDATLPAIEQTCRRNHQTFCVRCGD